MRFLNWSQVAVISEPRHGVLRLRQLVRTAGLEVHVRRAERRTYEAVLAELKVKEQYHLVIDTRAAHMRHLLAAIMRLQMNEYKYHYVFTSFDIDTMDLEDLKYNFVNITAFRLIDADDIGVREQLKEMERFARRQRQQRQQQQRRKGVVDDDSREEDEEEEEDGGGDGRSDWSGRSGTDGDNDEDDDIADDWSTNGVAAVDAGGVRYIRVGFLFVSCQAYFQHNITVK